MSKKNVVLNFKMSRQTAWELGLLICECGHRENNHYLDGDCARCSECTGLHERGVRGTVMTVARKRKASK